MSSARSRCKPILRPSTHSDCMALSQTMRSEDIAEIRAGSDLTPYEALKVGLDHSEECHTLVWENHVVLMFGVMRVGKAYSVWLLASDEFVRFTFHFVKECRRWRDDVLRRYGSLVGAVWDQNEAHVRFLRYLGFSFDNDPVYLKGNRFLVFTHEGKK